MDPGFADGHHNLAKALRASGHLREAADCYRAAVGLQPENAEIHYDLGEVLRAMNRMDEAVASYREAVRAANGLYQGLHRTLAAPSAL